MQPLPFRPISEFYKSHFGQKVYKIPVSVADDCPNRRGLKGMQTCVFCDVWGSAANSDAASMPLSEQIEKYAKKIGERSSASSFLVYFQAYTNTFLKIETLRENFEQSLCYHFVKGFVVGTRPDCLSPRVLELWQEFHERSFVAVELGVQSFFDPHLSFLRRGHTVAANFSAIQKISQNTSVDLGIHLMFGMPGETDAEIIETAKICNDLPISNVKLHNLHVLKNTPLEKFFHDGNFTPIEREPYAHRVQLFLEHLSPQIFVHRLAAFASRWEELVSPSWTSDKMGTHQYLIDHLNAERSFQSRFFEPRSREETELRDLLSRKVQPAADLRI